MDLTIKRYATWKDLLYYCRHSSHPVGRMVLLISGVSDPKLHSYSDYICGGLQLINFWQDTALDIRKGPHLYPLSELKKAGVREKDLLSLKDSPSVRVLVKNAVDYTETHFKRGCPLLDSVEEKLQWELRATYLGALESSKKSAGWITICSTAGRNWGLLISLPWP